MKRLLLLAAWMLAAPALAVEGFESGLGNWTAGGLWHRVQNPACFTPYAGAAAVYFGRDNGCDYADGAIKDASLSSGPITLSDPTQALFSFRMLYQVESFQPSCYDQIRLERSGDGVSWALLQDLSPGADPPGGGPGLGYASGGGLGGPALWQLHTADLGAFVPGTIYLRFRFLSSASQAGDPLCGGADADMDNHLGVAIDEIGVAEPLPRLSLQKSVDPPFGAPGSLLSYTLVARNTDTAAQDLQVWDSLPSGMNFVSADNGGSYAGGVVSWSLPATAAGTAVTLRLQLQADAGAPAPADRLNVGSAQGSAGGGVLQSSAVLYRLRDAGLRLSHSVAPGTITSGDRATFSLLVENYSATTQSALALDVQLPAGLVYNGSWPVMSSALRWDLPSLAPGQLRGYSFWGRGFGEDGAVLTAAGRLSQGGGLLQARNASITIKKPIEPALWLKAVYPNPAPSDKPGLPQSAFVYYESNLAMPVTLEIFSVAGEKVRSIQGQAQRGAQQMEWDLKNEWGAPVASGVYAFRLWSKILVIPTPEAWGYIAVLR